MNLFQEILYRPLFNLLVLIYQFLPFKDFGLAVIFLTILIRLIFYPLTLKSLKSEKEISDFQKEIEEIRKKYKDRESQAKALISLYKKKKFNPFGGFLVFIIQIPILIALFQLFSRGFETSGMEKLYGFVPKISSINSTFLGLVDLSKPNIFFALLAGIFQFFQSRFSFKKTKPVDKIAKISKMIQNQLLYFSAILAFLFLLRLPAALGLYWIVSSIFSIFQQKLIEKKYAS
jgi:YidC/Oxa1 family membrane protein insertase